jgi:nucleotide-binding universal stress UspA family protein
LHFLICSDGTPASDPATSFGAQLAISLRADVTVVEAPSGGLWERLASQASEAVRQSLTEAGLGCHVVTRSESPRRAITAQTRAEEYDIVVVGLLERGSRLRRWLRGPSTRRVLQDVTAPVLVVGADRSAIRRILLCSSDLWYPEENIRLVGQIAAATQAEVTLLYVIPRPAMEYPVPNRIDDDWGALLTTDTPQSRNLKAGRQALQDRGVPTMLSLRHGQVIDQIMDEIHTGEYDLVALGSTYAAQSLHRYFVTSIMDRVVERAHRPVLVVRHRQPKELG